MRELALGDPADDAPGSARRDAHELRRHRHDVPRVVEDQRDHAVGAGPHGGLVERELRQLDGFFAHARRLAQRRQPSLELVDRRLAALAAAEARAAFLRCRVEQVEARAQVGLLELLLLDDVRLHELLVGELLESFELLAHLGELGAVSGLRRLQAQHEQLGARDGGRPHDLLGAELRVGPVEREAGRRELDVELGGVHDGDDITGLDGLAHLHGDARDAPGRERRRRRVDVLGVAAQGDHAHTPPVR